MRPSVAIVLPLYNPSGDWKQNFIKNIQEIDAMLSSQVDINYVVVNDGSDTFDIGSFFHNLKEKHNVAYLSYKENQGKGYALRRGVMEATSDFVILTDFDFPYVMHNIKDVIQQMMQGYDVVIGRRSKAYFKNLPLKRRIISKSYMFLSWLSFKLPLYDIQSGIKGLGKKGKELFLETEVNRFLIDTEFVLRATRKNLVLKIIDVDLKENVVFSNFGMDTIITELRNFITLIKLNRSLKRIGQY